MSFVSSGVIVPDRRLSLAFRLNFIHQELLRLVDYWKPEDIAVEEPFVSQNPRTAIAIGQAQAIVLVVAASRDMEVSRYTPREVKHVVSGYGNSSKDQVKLSVRMQLEIKDHDLEEDAADALAVAICHIQARTEKRIIAQS
jgi:crossover junction endodeoxyribonuclease RuvC